MKEDRENGTTSFAFKSNNSPKVSMRGLLIDYDGLVPND